MILNKSKIEEAAKNEIPLFPVGNEEYIAKNSFKAGVSYAESELHELIIEFGEFVLAYEEPIYKVEGIFQEFLKQKNNDK